MRRAELPPANFRLYRNVESLAKPKVKAFKLTPKCRLPTARRRTLSRRSGSMIVDMLVKLPQVLNALLEGAVLLIGPTSVLTVRPITR